MWYESEMITETLDSLQQAMKEAKDQIDIILCLNSQTYIEKPKVGQPEDMFNLFLDHPIIKQAKIIYKTNNDSFYNIGDWRREIYDSNYKYTCWGESDCLIPKEYFSILEQVDIGEPHILCLASRKMWDTSWRYCEHYTLSDKHPVANAQPDYQTELIPLRFFDRINQEQLDTFNSNFDVYITKMPYNHVDGSLLALSANLPTPFIPNDMHFAREDLCASLYFSKVGVHQYCIVSKIKGHNYMHPLKRTNTDNTRSDEIYQQYVKKSEEAMYKFLS